MCENIQAHKTQIIYNENDAKSCVMARVLSSGLNEITTLFLLYFQFQVYFISIGFSSNFDHINFNTITII